jgi:ABC-type phosphate transport system auxiliary subunit
MGKLQKDKAKLESELSSLSSEYENQSIINRNMEYQKLSQKLK